MEISAEKQACNSNLKEIKWFRLCTLRAKVIADMDHLSDSWFKTEILGGLNGADFEFVDPSENDGQYGILASSILLLLLSMNVLFPVLTWKRLTCHNQ